MTPLSDNEEDEEATGDDEGEAASDCGSCASEYTSPGLFVGWRCHNRYVIWDFAIFISIFSTAYRCDENLE